MLRHWLTTKAAHLPAVSWLRQLDTSRNKAAFGFVCVRPSQIKPEDVDMFLKGGAALDISSSRKKPRVCSPT